MAIHYRLLQNKIKGSKNYRKYYAHTVKQGVISLEDIEETGAEVITGDIFSIENEKIRHDSLKTAYLIFSYLMNSEEKGS